eukprot:359219-Chlamydomonas_euryale.AAC.6
MVVKVRICCVQRCSVVTAVSPAGQGAAVTSQSHELHGADPRRGCLCSAQQDSRDQARAAGTRPLAKGATQHGPAPPIPRRCAWVTMPWQALRSGPYQDSFSQHEMKSERATSCRDGHLTTASVNVSH